MPRYAQLVMGPAGSGKSTYCSTIVKHCEASRRAVHVVNLDPAAEQFCYPLLADIRELISVGDVMEDEGLQLGPNGGLVYCLEYFANNLDWLDEQLDEIEDDYILFDCPGQIELYTHIPVMRQLVDHLQRTDFRVCGVFIMDAQFMVQPSKFVSGILSALSAMISLEIPHVNVMTKLDLLSRKAKKDLDRFLDPDMLSILSDDFGGGTFGEKFRNLNKSIAHMIDDYSLVKFLPLDQSDEESVGDVLLQVDMAIQFGEDAEPRTAVDTVEDVDEGADEDFAGGDS